MRYRQGYTGGRVGRAQERRWEAREIRKTDDGEEVAGDDGGGERQRGEESFRY